MIIIIIITIISIIIIIIIIMIIVINNHLDTSGGHHPGPSIHECGLPVTSGQTQPNGFQVYDVGRYIFIEVNMFELRHFWPKVKDMPKI